MPGIITIAQGEKRYIEMAKMLALSLINTNPGISRAILSDAPESEFKGLYDIYIPYDESYGKGFVLKLNLNKFSPYEETIFIDADSLVVSSLDEMIALCKPYSFVVFGNQTNSGEWYMDVAGICRKFNVPSIPLFNGGVYYFRKDAVTNNIYNTARQLKDQYADIGMESFRGMLADEPLMAVALAINQVEAVDDKGKAMRTPIGIQGALAIDVLNGVCSFNKDGEVVEPAIMHFAGDFAYYFHYKRECAKLKMFHLFPFLGRKLASMFINLGYNLSYGTYVFIKRISKMILRGERFDFSISLPLFPNR
jgi:hypothetical protein